MIFAETTRLPFDVGPLRALPYKLNTEGEPEAVISTRDAIAEKLTAARRYQTDSPLFQMVDGMQAQQLSHEKTDIFRDQVEYSERIKSELAESREQGVAAIAAIERKLGDIQSVEEYPELVWTRERRYLVLPAECILVVGFTSQSECIRTAFVRRPIQKGSVEIAFLA